ncbi:MAG: hypothetical protein RL222_932 [Bacteroidota bacterium]
MRDIKEFNNETFPRDFESFFYPFLILNSNNKSKIICIGKNKQSNVYYYKYGSILIGELNNDLSELIKIINTNKYNDFISDDDSNRIANIINDIESTIGNLNKE